MPVIPALIVLQPITKAAKRRQSTTKKVVKVGVNLGAQLCQV